MMLPKSIKRIGKDFLECLVAFAILNQVAHPVVLSFSMGIFARKQSPWKIQIISKDQYVDQFRFLDPSLDARDYLNLSNSIVHQYAREKNTKRESIYERMYICMIFADSTHDVYQTLVKNNFRNDLSDKVRMAGTTLGEGEGGHLWLEILENGEWVPYESVPYTPPLSEETVKTYSQKTKPIKSILGTSEGVGAEVLTIPGTEFFYPLPQSFLAPGGLAGTIYKIYKHKKGLERNNI